MEKRREEEERQTWYREKFAEMSLLDIYSSDMIGSIRRNIVRELLHAGAREEVIKSIIDPAFSEDQVIQKKTMWLEMMQK